MNGGTAFLRVREDFLASDGAERYLPVGVVAQDGDRVLIELPEEADSGVHRVWVSRADFRVFDLASGAAA